MALYKNVIRNVQREEEDDEEKLGYEFWNKVENAPVIKQIGNYFQQSNANIQAMNEYARSKENDNLLSKGLAWTSYGMGQVVGAPFELIDMGLEEISDRTNIDKRSLKLGLDLFIAAKGIKGSKTGAFNKGVQTRQGINKQYNKLANIFKKPGDQLIDIKSTRVFDDAASLSLNDAGIAKLLNPIFTAKELGLDPSGTTFFSMQNSDIPTYKGSSLDLNTAVHPTTYDGINTINTLLNKHGGFKGARLNLKSYDLKGSLDKRIAATVYFTPYGKGGNFQAIAKREKSIVYQIFGTDLERMGFAPVTEKTKTSPSVQAHHEKAPIKAIVPGFEGIVKESPKYHRFTKLFFDNMLALGDMPENITGVLGHVAKNPDSPHSLTHLFTRYMMGEDGKLFWTQDKLDQIVVYDNEGNAIGTKNDDLREKFILEQIDLLKDNIKVLENATEQYEILFKQGIQDPATVIEYFEEKLPNLDKEYIRAFAPKILEKFIAEVKAEEAATVLANPVTTSTRNEIIDNIFRRENVKRWRTWDVPVRKARMEEITDGWSFEQIEAFIDAGWLDDERLHELFNPPTEPENLFPDR